MARHTSTRTFTTPGALGSMRSMTSAFSPITASAFEGCCLDVKRNLAKGIKSGVRTTVSTANTVQGSQDKDEKYAATAAPTAPIATPKKKKWVGGGRISIIIQTMAVANQAFQLIMPPVTYLIK